MNYLLFVYYNDTVNNTELTTNEIATSITDRMTSKEVKFMFGDKHAIFHFSSNLTITEMGGWIDIINDDLNCFQYFLMPKPRKISSNTTKDNLDHLLSLRKTKVKKQTPKSPSIRRISDFTKRLENSFMDFESTLIKIRTDYVCNMTLDELLDKISLSGLNSLTKEEKDKLDEYSKTI